MRPRLDIAAELPVALVGGTATLLAAYLSTRLGAEISLGLVLAVAAFGGAVVAFLFYPHLAISATVALFVLVPTLKVFTWSGIGAIKDLIVLAAIVAAAILIAFERRPIDRWILIPVGVLLGLYVVNIGSGHDIAWAQGVRLVGEPLALLLVGLTLPDPRRTFRYAIGALVVMACVVAAYGLLQQLVGKYTLVSWGYSFDEQVRSLQSGQLRSFGTLDDPFTYAALLLFGLVGVVFWFRRGPLVWFCGLLIIAGIAVSFSRTAILIVLALGGLLLARRGQAVPAMLGLAATGLAGIVILAHAGGSESQSYPVSGQVGSSANVVLNGRISAWEAALGDQPADWLFGRGVGQVGTAAARSRYTIDPSAAKPATGQSRAVDSGYLATIADVGLVGLAALLALYGRLIAVAAAAARRRRSEGWVALGILLALLIDALTRASFTGFPTAFLGLLVVGLALSAAGQGAGSRPAAAAQP